MIQLAFLPVSNREDWKETIVLSDGDTGVAIDITGAAISLSVREQKSKVERLSASVGDGITLTNPMQGEFQWEFTDNQMAALDANTYDVGVVMVLSGVATQLITGTVPVVDGVVNAP
jgi:hypothetical protein